MALNYYAINKILGGEMVPGRRQQFGGFNTLRTVGDLLSHRPRKPKEVPFTFEMDASIAKAFEAIRRGMAPERILWDAHLAARFHAEARRRGVHAPASQLDRRLINIRKNSSRYRIHGIGLSKTTVLDPQPSVVPQYAHAIEFALVRLRSRYGASIDDILLNPELVAEYERLARLVAKDLTSTQLRLGALYIRKTRHVAKRDVPLLEELDPHRLEKNFRHLGTLDRVAVADVPENEGLIEVLEDRRYLYISRNANLRTVVSEFVQGSTLDLMANHFWTPRIQSIGLRILPGTVFENASVHRWQLKLIQQREPLFNWPVQAA